MGGIFSKPKEPDMPIAKPEVLPPTSKGVAGITTEKKKPIGSTRSKTVVAGDLTPPKLFKWGQLGR